jgi:hypothetical protein
MHNRRPDVNVFNQIKCLQINLQRRKTATAQLNQNILQNNYDIVIIQDNVIKSKVCGFPLSVRVYYNESEELPKSAIIIVNSKIQVLFLQSFSNGYSTFVNLQFKRKNFTILSAYFSPFDNFNQQLLHIKNSINSICPHNLIIGTDSNAKSRV